LLTSKLKLTKEISLEVYDVVLRFGSSKVTLVIEIEKPKENPFQVHVSK
jgi:hypothetical protein